MGRIAVLTTLVAFVLAGCGAAPPPPPPQAGDVSRLAVAIRSLGPDVDSAEAERAAKLAYAHTETLAQQYQITDPPLVHNTKVNMGLRPRGLCWHWAEDMEKRLNAEAFETLDMHRAIANSENVLRLEHSTAVISAKGDGFDAGLVLDPWRKGGRLTWVPVRGDPDYDWEPRNEVAARRLERQHGRIVSLTHDQRFLIDGVEYTLR
ncbi:MAG: hypothetical protein R6V26_14025 [Roseovarius sp.]